MVPAGSLLVLSTILVPAAASAATTIDNTEITSTVGFVSEYVFRGITQSDENPALQGSVDFNHSSGAYAGIWGSTVDFNDSDEASLETDLYAGYAEHAGTEVDPAKVLYWEIMAMVRWAIIALQQAQRHLSGEQHSLELALTGRMLPEIEFDLLRQVCDMENDDARSAPRP